jgi:2-dehydro-3-deoxygalactonokinase
MPALIALDWGTSSLRGFLMDSFGAVLETRSSKHGIQHLPEPGVAGYERAFTALCGDWLATYPDLPVVAGGMVGSAQGWVEAPYVRCPADTDSLAAAAVRVQTTLGPVIYIAPGVLLDPEDAAPDVMRGEEIQIAGALGAGLDPSQPACVILPGTHSKWLRLEAGRIVDFASYMTGEIFAVMRQHSILGRLMPETSDASDSDAATAFTLGLTAARRAGPGDLTHLLFTTRSLGLTGRLAPAVLADYLSGLLIGHEIRSGGARMIGADSPQIAMIGDPALCSRYLTAMAHMGLPAPMMLNNTAPRGLFRFAQALDLLPH